MKVVPPKDVQSIVRPTLFIKNTTHGNIIHQQARSDHVYYLFLSFYKHSWHN
jgi:hypothetical protein